MATTLPYAAGLPGKEMRHVTSETMKTVFTESNLSIGEDVERLKVMVCSMFVVLTHGIHGPVTGHGW